MNYEDIRKANETIKTTDIKGKEYAEVNQRIKAFRMCYPMGKITTDIISCKDGIVLMQAQVFDDNDKLLGTGYAYEKENSTFINKTSYIENCETSAVGRALGMCGFGIETSVASAEKVENAIANQDEPKATPKQLALIKKLVDDEKAMLDYYHIQKVEDLTVQQASEIISRKKGH